jgi:hypothetical protein
MIAEFDTKVAQAPRLQIASQDRSFVSYTSRKLEELSALS